METSQSDLDLDLSTMADSETDVASSSNLDSDSSGTSDSVTDIAIHSEIGPTDIFDAATVDGESDVDTTPLMDCAYPREGCPCEWGLSQPCCLRPSEGLSCSRRLVHGEFMASWSLFFDCGCLDVPECPELYDLCPPGRNP